MKKLLSLPAALLFSAIVFAQDTIPPPAKNFPDSSKMDTIPGASRENKDTSALSSANKWPDTTANRNMQDSSTDMATSKSQADSSSAKTPDADRVIMKDDKVMVVKNGDSTLLADSIKLESGAVVTTDGTVKYTSGKTATLKNGQYINLSATASENNSGSDSTTAAPATKSPDEDKDKVIMVGDKVFVVQGGDSTVLADSIKLKSGAVVKSDATVKFKDGTSTTLKNGQYIALNPAPAPAATESNSNTDSTKATATTTTTTTTESTTTTKAPAEDKVIMIDDKMMVIKNGDSTLLADSIKLNSGAVVKNDGSVIFKNGTTTKLKNGQFIGLNTAPAEGKKNKKGASKKKSNGK